MMAKKNQTQSRDRDATAKAESPTRCQVNISGIHVWMDRKELPDMRVSFVCKHCSKYIEAGRNPIRYDTLH